MLAWLYYRLVHEGWLSVLVILRVVGDNMLNTVKEDRNFTGTAEIVVEK
jgi:hypothetical protein